jgi:TRAP-type mannitol/chloroaromatic compound transport system substrate-binding protein
LRAIIDNGVEAASQDVTWKSIDRYSKDYVELRTKDKVSFYRTPAAILQSQLGAYDAVAEKKGAGNALFKEIESRRRPFAERSEVGFRQQRAPRDGVQPLLRPAPAWKKVVTD